MEKEAGAWLDVLVPPSPPPKGGTLALPLWDGRAVPVAVPAGAVPDTFLRVRVPVQSNTIGVNREAETATAVNALDLNMVPVAVPVAKSETQAWGLFSLTAPMKPSEVTAAATIAAAEPAKAPASERYDFDSDEDEGQGAVFSTGKYNMKMLTRLTQVTSKVMSCRILHLSRLMSNRWKGTSEQSLPVCGAFQTKTNFPTHCRSWTLTTYWHRAAMRQCELRGS